MEGLFKAAEDCGTTLSTYDEKRRGGAAYMPAGTLPKTRHGDATLTSTSPNAIVAGGASGGGSSLAPSHAPASPLLDFSDSADEISNPLLLMQGQQGKPVTLASPTISPRPPSTIPLVPAPPTAAVSTSSPVPVSAVSPSFTPSTATAPLSSAGKTPVDDPFGNTSSIDTLLGPSTNNSNTTTTTAGHANSNDLLDIFTAK